MMNFSKRLSKLFILVSLLHVSTVAAFAQYDSVFVSIPSGNYTVGAKGHLLNPERIVSVGSFEISSTEITNASFEKFVTATGYVTDAERYRNALVFEPGLEEFRWLEDSTANWRYPNGERRGGIEDKMNLPVTTISYEDALQYCLWANVRLPSLNEWEIASRAGSDATYYWGNSQDSLSAFANIWQGRNHKIESIEDGYLYTAPVARFRPNAFGLYDMYGNVFEFCSGTLTGDGKDVVHARGGSWWCSKNACNFFNSVDIGRVHRKASFSNQGFRVVKSQK